MLKSLFGPDLERRSGCGRWDLIGKPFLSITCEWNSFGVWFDVNSERNRPQPLRYTIKSLAIAELECVNQRGLVLDFPGRAGDFTSNLLSAGIGDHFYGSSDLPKNIYSK